MLPSTRSSSQRTPRLSLSARVTSGQDSWRYFSRYLGKRVAKEDSSRSPPGLSSLVRGLSLHWIRWRGAGAAALALLGVSVVGASVMGVSEVLIVLVLNKCVVLFCIICAFFIVFLLGGFY